MTIKYILHPGHVFSIYDGDLHFIGPRELADLYGVNPEECLDVRGHKRLNLDDYINLYPMRTGNYTVTVVSK